MEVLDGIPRPSVYTTSGPHTTFINDNRPIVLDGVGIFQTTSLGVLVLVLVLAKIPITTERQTT